MLFVTDFALVRLHSLTICKFEDLYFKNYAPNRQRILPKNEIVTLQEKIYNSLSRIFRKNVYNFYTFLQQFFIKTRCPTL